jgi:hypothetical protein
VVPRVAKADQSEKRWIFQALRIGLASLTKRRKESQGEVRTQESLDELEKEPIWLKITNRGLPSDTRRGTAAVL